MLAFLLLVLLQAPPLHLTKKWHDMVEVPPPQQGGAPGAPDVCVFFLDDVGARDVELLIASNKLPEIDGLAAQGTYFENGYGQPMCAPSRWSIMRSDWLGGNAGFACSPNEDGTGPGPTPATISHGLDSLPKAMEGAGYNTALFGRWGIGTWLGDEAGSKDYAWTPMLWGFETWRAGLPDGVEECVESPGTYTNWLRVDDGHVSIETKYHTIALVEEFLAWWQATPSPRFAFVSLQAAHKPFHWPPPEAMPEGWVQPPLQQNRTKFEAMVQSADWAVGEMLQAIDLEGTLVVLTADNGTPDQVPPLGYSTNEVKFSTFEGGVRVPFIVAGLGFPEAFVSDQPVSEVDLAPTFMELAGVVPLGSFDGQSIVPALENEPLERTWVYVQGNPGDVAAIEAQWKLRSRPNGNEFLYDLIEDPFENAPIDPDTPGYEDITARLRAAISGVQ